jgi:threonyl-tRNA synthetase
MLNITLPDGSLRQYPGPVTVAEVAASIGSGLAKAALAGKINGKVVDTSFVIAVDSPLSIITAKDADGLDVIRHSTAHLLAYAVKELFPEAQVTIGPVIENGFYYDFSYKRPFTPEDLTSIEKKMTELANKDEPVLRRVLPRDEAVAYFKGLGEHYKAEIIASIPNNEDVSLYREGKFEDLCRGPHVPSTGKLKHFKLMKVAGAYWRGDHRNEMLQRIYGTAWASKDELQQYLTMLEEAEKRDHRRLGRNWICSTSTSTRLARCSGILKAGRSGKRSNSTCAVSIARTATRRSKARRSSTRGSGRRPATGTSTGRTCL